MKWSFDESHLSSMEWVANHGGKIEFKDESAGGYVMGSVCITVNGERHEGPDFHSVVQILKDKLRSQAAHRAWETRRKKSY